MLEGIERLRDCTKRRAFNVSFEKTKLLEQLDAIEREVEERYVELPKDACGLPIHVGDRLCGCDRLYGYALGGEPVITVHHIVLYEDGWRISDSPTHEAIPNCYLQYKSLTVEDVLNELCTKAFHSRQPDAHVRYKDVIAEYAKRLQLKEEK